MGSPAAGLRCPGIAAVVFLAIIVAACGTAEAPRPGSAGASPAVSAGRSSASPSGRLATPSARPSATPRPSLPAPSDLGDRLHATIDGVASPCAMAVTATDVWVTGNAPSVLARVDPVTNTIVSQTPMEGSPCGIAVGPDGRLWIALLSIGQVVAVDPATATVVATVEDLGSQLWDLKAGFGAIWVVDRSKRELLRIDPVAAAVVARVPIGRSGSGLAIAADAIWVVDDVEGIVLRIDPATNVVTLTSTLRRGSSWFANDEGALVVANRLDGSITPIDGSDGTPGTPLTGPRSPLDGTVGGARAYIPDGKAGTLLEIDLATQAIALVDRLEGAKNPFVAEIAFGDVWVLDYGGRRIWRIAP